MMEEITGHGEGGGRGDGGGHGRDDGRGEGSWHLASTSRVPDLDAPRAPIHPLCLKGV